MPLSCAVAECKNIKSTGSKLVFHRFPTYDKDRCKSWEYKCKRKDRINVVNARICSDHFSEDDFERDLKNELLGLPLRRQLKKSAVPSVFPERCPTPSNDRCTRSEKRNNRKIIDDLLNTPLPESGDEERQDLEAINNPTSESSGNDNSPQLAEIRSLKKKIRELKTTITNLRHRLKIKAIQTKTRKTKNSSMFLPAQKKKLAGQKRVNWKTQEKMSNP